MVPRSAFCAEMETINRELHASLVRLQTLLEKKRRALKEAEILDDRRERDYLEAVVREIEKKIKEIREIGLPPQP